jgi:hypothetical protein
MLIDVTAVHKVSSYTLTATLHVLSLVKYSRSQGRQSLYHRLWSVDANRWTCRINVHPIVSHTGHPSLDSPREKHHTGLKSVSALGVQHLLAHSDIPLALDVFLEAPQNPRLELQSIRLAPVQLTANFTHT